MAERKKATYEFTRLEILMLRAEDVIATSAIGNTNHVDKNENSWVTPGVDNEWGL